MGFMTSTRAGRTPAKSAVGPSSLNSASNVASVDGFFFEMGFSDEVAGEGSEDSDWRAVMRVFTTQMGLVMRTVAEPAMAPQRIDSRVVRVWEVRARRRGVRVKKVRVHSYPVFCKSSFAF